VTKNKEYETIKEYLDTLLGIANKIRLLGSNFADSRIGRSATWFAGTRAM